MEVQFGPNSVDEPNLLYKLQRKIKVFNTCDTLPNRGYNLVASSSKYGLVFVAVPDGSLSVYHLNHLVDKESESPHLSIKLHEKPTHIAVSCDYELLAVTGGQLLCIYKVVDFQNPNIAPALTIKTEVNPSTFVSALQWNPCIPDSIAIAFYDGTLFACTANNGQVKKVPSKVRCICWSPKGKQLVTGNSDGSLCQYKPDLTQAKVIPPPKLFDGSPVEALAVYWISTFQFAVVYKNATDNSRPAVTIVNTPKGAQPSCLNYEDICYSMGSNRPWYYYLQGLPQWNIILSSSSNSMEIATLGSADGSNWMQWCQSDEARPELPLTDKKQENYPVGISIDVCAIHQLPWGENETLPHMPLLHVVSQTGLLTIFNVINLSKQAAQVCSPPTQINLPVNAMTSSVPGEAPKPAPAPAPTPIPVATPIEIKPQPAPVPAVQTMPQNVNASHPQTAPAGFKIPSFQPSQQFSPAPATKVPEAKPEVKPAPQIQQPAAAPPKPQPVPTPQAKPQQTQESAAMKAEQDKINKMKANQELKNMLIKEVNDFQMELYKFMVKTRETQTKIQRDIESMNSNFNFNALDTEQLKKDCSIEELRGAIVELKLELVRACAVVAEARTHSEAKEYHEWTQADPLTTQRVASIKKLAYYIQSQLDQAHKALDYKWNEITSRDSRYNKPGTRMIRPLLDDVYQPLVKQQEILSRQQAVLRSLRKTLNECDVGPVFKSTSLLKTPYRKDNLSKLTKNILNMSIEPKPTQEESLFTPQKLEALRDALSNHKTTRIKPVNIELRQHLEIMRQKYEKSLKEKLIAKTDPEKAEITPKVTVKSEPEPMPVVKEVPKPMPVKTEPKLEPLRQPTSVPSFAPVSNRTVQPGLQNVARTLFTDEPTQETPKPQPQVQFQPSLPKPTIKQPSPFTATTQSSNVIKDLLKSNSQTNLSAKNDNNTFMGQKICSPTAFGQQTAVSPSPAPTMFTSKPLTDINNMFRKFQPQTFAEQTVTEPKPQTNVKSSETGEPETKPFEFKPKDKPITNLFGMRPVSQTTSNVPDVVKSLPEKAESKVSVKSVESLPEKSKENVPEKTENVSVQKVAEKKDPVKPLGVQSAIKNEATPKTSISNEKSVSKLESKAIEKPKAVEKPEPQTVTSTTVSNSGSKQASPASSETPKSPEKEKPKEPASTASSIFGAAAASTPKTTATSIFSSSSAFTSTTQPSVFGTSQADSTTTKSSAFGAPALFGSSTTSIFGTSQTTSAASVFAAAVSAPSVFGTAPSEATSTTPPTTTSSVLGTATTTPTFGTPTATTTPVFATATTTSSVFGATTSIFNATTSTTNFATTSTSVFGTATVTTPAPVFGTVTSVPSAFAPTTSSIFGTATTTASIFSTATTQSSVFGQAAQSVFGSTTQPSIFGATTQASVFGSAPTQPVFGTATTTQASVFGTPPAQPVFGQTTQATVFGSSTPPAPMFGTPTQATQTSVFGTPTQPTQPSIFGTPTQTTQAPLFGTPTQTTQTSVFGTPTQTTQASVFGTPPQQTQGSVFGAPTTTQSGSLFGGGESNLFAAASISTTSASGGSIFGGSSPGSVFGSSGTNVFGGKTTFGQSNASTASIFGGGGANSTFGDKTANNFWAGANNNTGGFGSSGFGQQATTQSSSIFGGTTGGSFSAPSAGAFGSPQPNAFGSTEAKPSVFGSPQQQTAPAFGGSPVFGSKPVFGQPAAGGFGSFGGFNKSPSSGFGAPASFGGGAAFGSSAFGGGTSPGKMFGNATPSFGSPTQSNPTFENLATQNTLTFGNLAQQSGQQQQSAPAFNTSPSFTGWRG